MSRIEMVNPEEATGTTKRLLDGVRKSMGMTPNLVRSMAASPAVLEGFLGLSGALSKSSLDASLREKIALTVSQYNECPYCLASHMATAKGMGLDEGEILASRRASSEDPKTDADLKFAHALVERRAEVTDEEIERLKGAGYDDAEVAEIVASVVLNIFTNYFHHVAETELEFPAVEVKLAS